MLAVRVARGTLLTAALCFASLALASPRLEVTPALVHADVFAGDEALRTLAITNAGDTPLAYRLRVRGAPQDARGTAAVPAARQAIASHAPRLDETGRDATGEAVPGAARATLAPQLPGDDVLLVEESLPSGSTADEDLLQAAGATVDRISAAAFAGTDLTRYAIIVIASDQSTDFYATLSQQAARLEAWVAAGGVLQAQLAGWFESGDASRLQLPNGVTAQPGFSRTNQVALPSHPLVAGLSPSITGTFASRGHLAGLPADAEIITRDPDGGATLAVYHVGAGTVIAGVQPYEYGVLAGQAVGQILRNMISFARSGAGSRWLRFEPIAGSLAPGATATVALHLPSEGLAAGDYAQDLEVLTDDPGHASVKIPVTMHVADAPHLEVSGPEVALESRQVFFSNGVTRHRFMVGAVSASRIDFDLDVSGNFGNPGSYASFVVEGTTLGRAGEVDDNNTCAPAGATFSLTGAALAAALADGIVDVEVRNSSRVDPSMCFVHEHHVRMRFRETGDVVAFTNRFLGTCDSRARVVRNTGTLPLTVRGYELSNGAFTQDAVPVTLLPGAEAAATLAFCPQVAGTFDGPWTILSDDPRGARHDVALKGVGLVPPAIAAAPSALIEDLFAGEHSLRTLRVSNLGGSELHASLRLGLDATLPADAAGARRAGGALPSTHRSLAQPRTQVNAVDASTESVARPLAPRVAAGALASPAQPPTTVFADDMESPGNGWTTYITTGSVNQWSRTTTRANSGTTSWNARNGYSPGSSALQSPVLDLRPFRHAQLTFRHFYRFGCADAPGFSPFGGIVEAQVDGDIGWVQLTPVGGYPSVVQATHEIDRPCPQPLEGLSAYAQDGDDAGAFLTATFDLSEFAGHVTRFRFHAGWGCEGRHDCGLNEGWYVDDVRVTADAPRWLELAPVSATIPAGAQQDVSLAFDTASIGPGDWNAVVDMISNDPRAPVLSVPVTLHVATVAAALTLDHRTLEPDKGGPWLKATLALPGDRRPDDLDAASVTLNGVPAERELVLGNAVARGRAEPPHAARLMFRIDRDAVLATFTGTPRQALGLSGRFRDGALFLARDSVTVRVEQSGALGNAAQRAVGDGASALDVLAAAETLPSLSLAPNPARRGSPLGVMLSLARGGQVDAAVYSLTGQLVRTLASGTSPAGLSSLVWDGRDRGGNQVQPGIYMVRVVAPGLSTTRRAVLLR